MYKDGAVLVILKYRTIGIGLKCTIYK